MIDRYNFNLSTNSTVDVLGTYTSSGEVRFETILFCIQHKCLIWWVYVLVCWVFPPPKTRGVVYLCNEKPEFRNILGAWVVRCTHVSDQVSLKSVTCHVSHLPGALMDALLTACREEIEAVDLPYLVMQVQEESQQLPMLSFINLRARVRDW